MEGCKVIVFILGLAVCAASPVQLISISSYDGSLPALQIPENLDLFFPEESETEEVISEIENEEELEPETSVDEYEEAYGSGPDSEENEIETPINQDKLEEGNKNIDHLKNLLLQGDFDAIRDLLEEILQEGVEIPRWMEWLVEHPRIAKWVDVYVSTMFWIQKQPEMGKLPFLNPKWLKWLQERPGILPVPSVLPEELPWWYLSLYTRPASKQNTDNLRFLAPFHLPYNAVPQF